MIATEPTFRRKCLLRIINIIMILAMGVDHGVMRGGIPPTTEAGGWPVQSSPYNGDEQMKSIFHNTQINNPKEVVSYIDDEMIFSRKLE